MFPRRDFTGLLCASVCLTALLSAEALADTTGKPRAWGLGVSRTTAQIMAVKWVPSAAVTQARLNWELEEPDRSALPQASGAASQAFWPPREDARVQPPIVDSPQTVPLSFTGATLTDTGSFPPDDMAAVGPTQLIVFVNGRLRSFSKSSGAADGVLNADPDVFFAPVMTPVGGSILLNFTSDPQIRYDRLSGRWFVSILDVPCTTSNCSVVAANRWLLAVSDAASAGTITNSTVWTFFFFQGDASNFLDYPSLGVDANALYVGGDMFSSAGSFVGTNGYVVRKSSVLGAGPMVVTGFAGLATGTGDGLYAPRGVDNFDPAATEGYFIGVSNAVFGQLNLRRVSNPGGSPSLSSDIPIAVNTTAFPINVDHLGNTGGSNGRLAALDDRLYAAHIRNGRLWTAHNIAVTAAGVASNSNSQRRDGVRWYELNGIRSTDNGGVPVVIQSGTLFDNATTVATARQYWIPTVTVSGQGHAALGFSTAGTPFRVDAATVGRLAGDSPGTLGSVALFSSSSTAYNPPSDPGGTGGRRWGDYSFVSVDPLDDMTMWTVEQFCSGTNLYGCRVGKLLAPLPATPASVPSVEAGHGSVSVTVTGTSSAGTGFYDPGADLSSPALPFQHIAATVTNTGVTGTPPTVNSVTYVDPTHVQLNLNTIGASPNLTGEKYSVTITNPDGQQATGSMILQVTAPVSAVAPDGAAPFGLESIAPNPTTGRVRVGFSVARDAEVELSVLDVSGRVVATLARGEWPAGHHFETWNGMRGGEPVDAGVYFVRYRAAGIEQVRRLAITR